MTTSASAKTSVHGPDVGSPPLNCSGAAYAGAKYDGVIEIG
jgi:hypothetical protein